MQPSDIDLTAVESLVKQGMTALRNSNRAEAYERLVEALKLHPGSEQAWLWMSGAVSTPGERRYCLERVLAINSEHAFAQKGLLQLQDIPAAPPPFVQQQPASNAHPPDAPATQATDSEPPVPPASDLDSAPVSDPASTPASEPVSEPGSAPAVAPPGEATSSPTNKKRSFPLWAIGVLVALISVIIIGIVAFVLLSSSAAPPPQSLLTLVPLA
jgi:hypothetical protein